jgi:hypothetical protein
MNFNNIFSEWKNKGTEPSEDLKESGFKAGYKPPANIFNWFWSKVISAISELQTTFKSHSESAILDHPDGSVTKDKLNDDVFKFTSDKVYPIDVSKVGSANNILWVDIPNITSYDEMDGKMIAISTGIYCCQWDTPQTVYINVNGLGARALRRPLPTNSSADYDTKQYYTDKYVKGEISRSQTLLIAFSGATVTLLNPAAPPRATKEIASDSKDETSYITPKNITSLLKEVGYTSCGIAGVTDYLDISVVCVDELIIGQTESSVDITIIYGREKQVMKFSAATDLGTNQDYLILGYAYDPDWGTRESLFVTTQEAFPEDGFSTEYREVLRIYENTIYFESGNIFTGEEDTTSPSRRITLLEGQLESVKNSITSATLPDGTTVEAAITALESRIAALEPPSGNTIAYIKNN